MDKYLEALFKKLFLSFIFFGLTFGIILLFYIQKIPSGFQESIRVVLPPTPMGYSGDLEPIVEYVPQKSIWDWLELLIIPIAVTVFTLLFNQGMRKRELETQQRRRYVDKKIEIERYNSEIMQKYLDDISELLLNHDLIQEKENLNSSVRDVAQTKTIIALRTLASDSNRKDNILQSLRDAQLSDFLFVKSWLKEINLEKTNLSGINFSNANLEKAKFRRASVRGTNFENANLANSDFREANLRNAIFLNANLSNCVFKDAVITLEQINEAKSITGIMLPDGSIHEEKRYPLG
jgi:uncharacterized protein YjbI with pentapeptide repeats